MLGWDLSRDDDSDGNDVVGQPLGTNRRHASEKGKRGKMWRILVMGWKGLPSFLVIVYVTKGVWR